MSPSKAPTSIGAKAGPSAQSPGSAGPGLPPLAGSAEKAGGYGITRLGQGLKGRFILRSDHVIPAQGTRKPEMGLSAQRYQIHHRNCTSELICCCFHYN